MKRRVAARYSTESTRAILGARGLLMAVLLVMLGNGLMNPLLGIRAEIEGFSTTSTGIILSFYFVGFLAGARLTRRLLMTVGHIRVYAGLASLASTSTLIYIVSVSPAAWSLARMINGFAMSGIYIVGESWLNDMASNRTRGRLISLYMVALMGGLAAGQLLVSVGDPAGIGLFVTASILVSVAVIPITLVPASAPSLQSTPMLPISEVWRAAPLGLFTAFTQGVGVAALLSLSAVFAARSGMTVASIAVFTFVVVAGNVALQPILGWLSDVAGRRRVILFSGFTCASACLGMVYVDPLSRWAMVLAFLAGGTALSMYPLALTHINDRVPPGSAIGVSSLLSFVAGVGSIMGPIAAATAMDAMGPAGLYWMTGTLFLVVSLFSMLRIFSREGVPKEQRRPFASIPTRAGSVMIQMTRRLRRSPAKRSDSPSNPESPHG